MSILNTRDISIGGGSTTFNHVDLYKNFTVQGNSNNGTLGLTDLHRWVNTAKGNIDIKYDGGGGEDTLDYSGDVTSIEVKASNVSGYELYLDGGRGKEHGRQNLESLEVWTNDVETIKLGRNDDRVDLTALTSWVNTAIYGADGFDTMDGSAFADWFHGGGDDDVLNGHSGNDVLDGGSGSNTVSGGAGSDVLYASVDLTSSDTSHYYGDWEDDGSGYGPAAGGFNESDVFVIGYQHTTTTATSSGDFWSTLLQEDAVDAGASAAGKILSTALGAPWSSSLIEYGFATIADAAISGAQSDSVYTTKTVVSGSVTIHDFDPWADVAVIALDEYVTDITSADNRTAVGNKATVALGDNPFLSMFMDTVSSSVFDGMFENGTDIESLEPAEITDILNNMLSNSVHVSTANGVLQAKAVNGVDLTLADSGAVLNGVVSELGTSDGVWLIGNYGGGTMFGHGASALAGSNSDDVLYSGQLDGQGNLTSFFFSDVKIKIFAGDGDDIVFGSKAAEDYLYGGKGDDYLHVVSAGLGDNSVELDRLFGGEGLDVAAFSQISVVNGPTEGISVALGQLESDASDGVSTQYAEVFYRDTGGNAIARLYDMEGVEGTKFDDFLTGDATANILHGSGGNDTISGGSGNDTIMGGAGDDILSGGGDSDKFVFDATFGNDTITDFGDNDVLVFEGLTAAQHATLITSLNAGGSTVSLSAEDRVSLTGISIASLEATTTTNLEDPTLFDVTVFAEAGTARALDMTPLSDDEALLYLASNDDLIAAFGLDLNAARSHYETSGRTELRSFDFDAVQYLANYSDLEAAFGSNTDLATRHYVTSGYSEGRSDGANLTDSLDASNASQSSNYSDTNWLAGQVLDGDVTTINHTGRSDASPWLMIDMEEYAEIDVVRIENRQDNWTSSRLTGANVEVLNNGNVVWTSADLTGAHTQTIDVGGVIGDQVRIAHEDGTYVHVGEIDILGEFLGYTNLTDTLALTAASQSSNYSDTDWLARNMIDNDESTLNHTGRNDASPSVSIKLGEDAVIEFVDLVNRSDGWVANRLVGANVEIWDNSALVWSSADLTSATHQNIDVGGVVGDEVRINHTDGQYIHIAELDIYGDFLM